jgi:hypothetical protein
MGKIIISENLVNDIIVNENKYTNIKKDCANTKICNS